MTFTKMILELNKRYEDRMGNIWLVTEIRDKGAHPVTAVRYTGTAHATRTYLRDGKFYESFEDLNDLVREVP